MAYAVTTVARSVRCSGTDHRRSGGKNALTNAAAYSAAVTAPKIRPKRRACDVGLPATEPYQGDSTGREDDEHGPVRRAVYRELALCGDVTILTAACV